jgi:Dyp-type peroxidase family
MPLNPAEIQGDIVPGFRRRYHDTFAQLFIPLTIATGREEAARAALATLVDDHFTSADDVAGRSRSSGGAGLRDDGRPDVNFAVTAAGVRRLRPELTDQVAGRVAFAAGLAARSLERDLLGDPERWELGRDDDVHVVLNIAWVPRDDALVDQINGQVDEIRRIAADGFVLAREHGGHSLPAGVEHFGFRDGISQPQVDFPQRPGGPAIGPSPVGQFIVESDDFWNGGSFMVWLRLRQDVDGFRRACERMAAKLSIEWGQQIVPDEAAALLVGRRKDGTPLAQGGLFEMNEFSYRHESGLGPDPAGVRCPLGSHTRKMNPRTPEATDHLFIRRGIPYTETDGDEVTDRGLLFVAYQSSIEDQFEELQGVWANRVSTPEPWGSADALISQSSIAGTSFEVPNPNGRGSVGIGIRNRWVVPIGGWYLFVPAKPSLDLLTGRR